MSSRSASFCSIAGWPAGYMPVRRRSVTKPLSSARGSRVRSGACAVGLQRGGMACLSSSPARRSARALRPIRASDGFQIRYRSACRGSRMADGVRVLARRVVDQPAGGVRLAHHEVAARQEPDDLSIGFRPWESATTSARQRTRPSHFPPGCWPPPARRRATYRCARAPAAPRGPSARRSLCSSDPTVASCP